MSLASQEKLPTVANRAIAHYHDDDSHEYCRICRGEASPQQPLFYPCKCSGSIKYVHQECLKEWLSHSQKKYCELCKTSFRFTKLYDRSMPRTLPFPLFLNQLARHALSAVARYTRYLLVALVWLCCLPWCIRQIWRGLFWLADGDWMDGEYTQHGENATLMATPLATTIPPEVPALQFPQTFERIQFVLPPMQLSLADILRALFSQVPLGRLLRLLFNTLVPSTSSGEGAPLSMPEVSQRSTSLLSDIQFLANWSGISALNHLTLDVVEGQLICISLVTAFILVFLIREWVINQQPIHNMPDPDGQENPAPQAQLIPPAGDPVLPVNPPRQAHNPQTPLEQAHHGIPIDHPQPLQVIPRPRRTLSGDNILNGVHAQRDALALPKRSLSLSSDHLDRNTPDLPGHELDEDSSLFQSTDTADLWSHPSSNSIYVQNEVEVIPDDDPIEDDAFEGRFGGHNYSGPEPSVRDMENQFFLGQDRRLMLPRRGSATVGEAPSEGMGDSNSRPVQIRVSHPLETDEDVASTTAELSVTEAEPATSEADSERVSGSFLSAGGESPVAVDIPEPAEMSRMQRVTAYLWHLDAQQQAPRRPQPTEVEQLGRDLNVEPPLGHLHDQEHALRAAQPPLDAPPAPVREPNIVFGVDLNDPNAADDAEDMDGILELLGMEGPIFGMVQNVVFSLFLITVTLSASIWCPYIWGKIALLLMANPWGMLIKAPLFVLSSAADIVVDIFLFVLGLLGLLLNMPFKLLQSSTAALFPKAPSFIDLDSIQAVLLGWSQKSGARLERTLSGAVFNLKPDLPTFSILSHHALRSFKAYFQATLRWMASGILQTQQFALTAPSTLRPLRPSTFMPFSELVLSAAHSLRSTIQGFYFFATSFNNGTSTRSRPADVSSEPWTTEDRIITIILGYAFFAVAGVLFLEVAHLALGLKDDEKVEGYFADCLRQAGGVMKVIIIIGIEMLVFPLYCGLLLDVALLPLFADATITSRLTFLMRAPFTGVFIHWFIGTCYMFHFALFVSICRKILRKGVLYFIRDPDDPTFHPVRDVLERPVPTQLGKIAFSALVYGGLVMLCLGGVVWSLDWLGGILPIQWATSEPKLAFPVDIVFYNFVLPFALRKADPSKKISSLYEWWFRRCAKILRLTAFLFGEDRAEERTGTRPLSVFWGTQKPAAERDLIPDGTFVRAPASDSVRIPRGQSVFLEVDESNQRMDGEPDTDIGIHGKKDERFVKIYLPPNFRMRIATFILLLWLFAASTGVSFTIGPLLVGRRIMRWLAQSEAPPNDLYAFTVGIHLFVLMAYGVFIGPQALRSIKLKSEASWSHHQHTVFRAIAAIEHLCGLVYLGLFTAFILPCVMSIIVELYVHIPVFTYLQLDRKAISEPRGLLQPSPASIFILPTWTIGLLYLRLFLRAVIYYFGAESPVVLAFQAIGRDGMLRPDVRLASRAFVLPATVICSLLLIIPLAVAKVTIVVSGTGEGAAQTRIYRLTYPGLLAIFLAWSAIFLMQRQISKWRIKIRDEVYLIGERLHNFHENNRPMSLGEKAKQRRL